MPQKPKDKTIQLKKGNMKKVTITKNARRKTRAPPTKNPHPIQDLSGTKRIGRKRRQANSTGGSLAKILKTCPLTAADIPEIISVVVQALPSTFVTSWTTSNTDQTGQTTDTRVTSCCHRTETTTIRQPYDSADEEDTENEDLSK